LVKLLFRETFSDNLDFDVCYQGHDPKGGEGEVRVVRSFAGGEEEIRVASRGKS